MPELIDSGNVIAWLNVQIEKARRGDLPIDAIAYYGDAIMFVKNLPTIEAEPVRQGTVLGLCDYGGKGDSVIMDIENFKENFIAFLKEQFMSVYCGTCKANENDNYDACCECHRKAMNWEISNYTAESVADKAIELLTNSATKDGADNAKSD